MIGYILFGTGIAMFLIGLVWWIVEMILRCRTHDDKHMALMWISVIVLNLGNIIVQIGNIIIKHGA